MDIIRVDESMATLVERENQEKECSKSDVPWNLCLNCQQLNNTNTAEDKAG